MIKQRLFTPGPTDVPPEVLVEMAKPIFHHRTERFKEMFGEVNEGLKKLLFTANDVLTLAGSGTAAMEAAIACAVPRDKKVLVANGGKFGERWVKVAKVYGLDLDEFKIEWGTAITPADGEGEAGHRPVRRGGRRPQRDLHRHRLRPGGHRPEVVAGPTRS